MTRHRTTARGGLLLILAALLGLAVAASAGGASKTGLTGSAGTASKTGLLATSGSAGTASKTGLLATSGSAGTASKTGLLATSASAGTASKTGLLATSGSAGTAAKTGRLAASASVRGATKTRLNAAASAGKASESKPGLVSGKPIVFPLIGDYAYTMNFGDARGQGAHEGIDIEHVPRRTPVVAAEAGTIKWWTTSWRAGCMLYLYGKSGTTYLYIHLNNDLTDASEDRGGCKRGVAYAVPNGAKVSAGEQIAWSGDSGDAEGNFHLHFEVHPGDGGAVNPYPYLNMAERLLFPGRLGAPYSLGVRGEPIAAGAGTLRLRATAVRWWPGGQWTPLVRERVVSLAVAGDASVDQSIASALAGAEIETLQALPGGTVTAFTAQGETTGAALRGKPGALVVARVTRPGGTQVALEGPLSNVPEPAATDENDDSAPGLPGGA